MIQDIQNNQIFLNKISTTTQCKKFDFRMTKDKISFSATKSPQRVLREIQLLTGELSSKFLPKVEDIILLARSFPEAKGKIGTIPWPSKTPLDVFDGFAAVAKELRASRDVRGTSVFLTKILNEAGIIPSKSKVLLKEHGIGYFGIAYKFALGGEEYNLKVFKNNSILETLVMLREAENKLKERDFVGVIENIYKGIASVGKDLKQISNDTKKQQRLKLKNILLKEISHGVHFETNRALSIGKNLPAGHQYEKARIYFADLDSGYMVTKFTPIDAAAPTTRINLRNFGIVSTDTLKTSITSESKSKNENNGNIFDFGGLLCKHGALSTDLEALNIYEKISSADEVKRVQLWIEQFNKNKDNFHIQKGLLYAVENIPKQDRIKITKMINVLKSVKSGNRSIFSNDILQRNIFGEFIIFRGNCLKTFKSLNDKLSSLRN